MTVDKRPAIEVNYHRCAENPTAETLLATLLAHTPIAMAILDQNLCYIGVNQQWRDRFDQFPTRWLGKSHFDVMAHQCEAWKSVFSQVLSGQTVDPQTEISQHPDRGRERLTWQISAWQESNQQIAGLVLSVIGIEAVPEPSRSSPEPHLLVSNSVANVSPLLAKIHHNIQAESHRLRQQLKLLADVLDNTDACVFIKDYRSYPGSYILVNRALSELVQKPIANVLGKTDFDLFSTETAKKHRADDQIVLSQKQPLAVENIFASDQSDRVLSATKYPLIDDQGDIYGVCGIATDITDQVAIADELRQSQKFLQLIINNIPQAVFWKDPQSVYLGCNQHFAQAAGVDHVADVIGKTDYDLAWSTEEADVYRANDLHIMETGIPQYHLLEPQFTSDQRQIWCDTNKIPLYDDAGTLVGILGTYEDVTDRIQAELDLKARIRREQLLYKLSNIIRESLDLKRVLDTTVQEIYTLLEVDYCYVAWYQAAAPDTHDDNSSAHYPAWTVVSEARSELLPSQLGHHPVAQFRHLSDLMLKQDTIQIHDSHQLDSRPVKTILKQLGYRAALILPVQGKGGEIGIINCIQQQPRVWTEEEVHLLEAIVAQLGIALNQADLYAQSVTKAAELEATLQQLQRTQSQMVQAEKMSSLGQLVAGVAHEINNPVNFIYGNIAHANEYAMDLLALIRLYQAEYPNPSAAIARELEAVDLEFLAEDLPKLLSSMKLGADRIKKIVASLRTFSRMDEADRKAVDIHEGIDSTLMILHNRIRERPDRIGIEVVHQFASLPKIECYAGQLNQVFMNLLSNAIDAVEEKLHHQANYQPAIHITTRVVDGTWVEIDIQDNGSGIPAAVQQRIFDPFFTTKPVGQGTGMGLSISHQIITENHQGRFTCQSTPGEGTTFTIAIPYLPPADPADSQDESPR